MKIYLVSRARAVGRPDWPGRDDDPRPLSELGRRQAERIAAEIASDPPARILAAPALRCQQTVAPLSAALGLEVETDERLAIGADLVGVFEALASGGEGSLAICTHTRVVDTLLRTLEMTGSEGARSRKGGLWVLEGPDDTLATARYLDTSELEPRSGSIGISGEQVTRAAVLDLGSTSFDLLIADVTASGEIEPVQSAKRMVPIGFPLGEPGIISDSLRNRGCRAAAQLSQIVSRSGVSHFFPVATAALRRATNGRAVSEQIGSAIGQPVRILSGEEEGRTLFRALHQRLGLGSGSATALDLGGASLGIVIGGGERIEAALTTRLGVAALRRAINAHDPMTAAEVAKLRAFVEAELEQHREFLAAGAGREAVVSGDTARALVQLLGEGVAKAEPCAPLPFVSRRVLRQLSRSLAETSHEERLRIEGVSASQVDLLPVGAVLLEEVAAQLDLRGYQLCDWGLREGVLLDAVLPA